MSRKTGKQKRSAKLRRQRREYRARRRERDAKAAPTIPSTELTAISEIAGRSHE